MPIVTGVDFGTLSVRVSLVDSDRGLLESCCKILVHEGFIHRAERFIVDTPLEKTENAEEISGVKCIRFTYKEVNSY
jgi:ribulose kinase